jgi:hypothetical protein
MRLLCALFLGACLTMSAADRDKDSKSRNRAETRQTQNTFVGVIDQTGNDFILTYEDSMEKKALLRSQGFSSDNFARFVGHRVEVRGDIEAEGERQVLTVKSLNNLKRIDESQTQR